MVTQVNEIRIIPIRAMKDEKQKDTLVALATCVLDSKFFVGSIGVYEREDKTYRITYPTKKSGISSLKLFYPISKEVGDDIENAIIEEFVKVISEDV